MSEFAVVIPPQKALPWWICSVIFIAILVEIVVGGSIEYSPVLDAVSVATAIALPTSLILLALTELLLTRRRRAATSALVYEASGVMLTPREAGQFIRAVEAIRTHFSARDVRDAPPVGLVPLLSLPGHRLRVQWRHPGYFAVVEPITAADAA